MFQVFLCPWVLLWVLASLGYHWLAQSTVPLRGRQNFFCKHKTQIPWPLVSHLDPL